ncbi:DUF2911 domain-containing protein [Limibacter armeniacum]|uniref:DUF2911 domain-containing protein n=1 Tax=Limibacter armeniacum TaxID=466084 RepID=UPI002FE684E8
MRNSKLMNALLLVVAMVFANFANAQELPAPSPAASVMARVGLTDITVDYSSPAVKGRKVFGELEPYGVAWRAGANGPTKITFSTDVKVGGKDLKAGAYHIFLTPMAEGDWTFHFNGKGSSVFTYLKGGKQDTEALKADDVATAAAKPAEAPMKERLAYLIEPVSETEGKVTLWWNKTMVSFNVTVPTNEVAMANIDQTKKELGNAWRNYQRIAQYYASNGDMENAMAMIDKSIATKDYFWNKWVKAGFLAEQENWDAALDLMLEAQEAGKANPDGTYEYFQPQMEKDFAVWKENASKKWLKAYSKKN